MGGRGGVRRRGEEHVGPINGGTAAPSSGRVMGVLVFGAGEGRGSPKKQVSEWYKSNIFSRKKVKREFTMALT